VPDNLTFRPVADELSESQLQNPSFPFLDVTPSLVRILMFQPRDVIFADDSRVGSANGTLLSAQMRAFLQKAADTGSDIALCPEYSCTWSAVIDSVGAGIFPAVGKLWALGCESATPAELQVVFERLSDHLAIVIDRPTLDVSGNFISPLCYLFRTKGLDGREAKVILIQAKTQPMGGTPFEEQFLKKGHKIYQFSNTGGKSNSLVGLVCSDSLHPSFSTEVLPYLQSNTLILHLQMNRSPEAATFRSYRESCCNIVPRSTEILCLNWARGTQLDSGGSVVPLICEPKSFLFRDPQQLVSDDQRILENHSKGCYLTNWHEHRTAALLFAPDAFVFYFETSKPFVTGPATTAIKYGPRMIELMAWSDTNGQWIPTTADDHFRAYWYDTVPALQEILAVLLMHQLGAERLIQLSTGHAMEWNWPEWITMPSFRLADDETSCRLTLCWSTSGKGPDFRDKCRSRFIGFAGVISNPAQFSIRLNQFKQGAPLEVTFKSDSRANRFRNLHLQNGFAATAVYLGENPPNHILQETKSKTQASLLDLNCDAQSLAIWYRDHNGSLHDFMDRDIPRYNSDPGMNPIGITDPSQ